MMTNDIEWKMVKLGDLFRLSAGGDIDKEHFSEHKTSTCKYPVYSNAIENFGIYGFTSKPNYTGNSVTITGRGNVGYAFFREEPFDAIVRLLVLEPKESNINSYYVASYINQNVEFPIESTGVPQLTIPQIKNVSIPIPHKNGVPDLEAQRQIAQKLGDMDSLIAAKEKLLAKKRNLKVAAMQQLIKDEEGENWKRVKLGEVCSMPTKTVCSNSFDSRFYIGTENMLQNCSGVSANEIALLYERVREYKKDDILMSNIRPYLKKIWLSDKDAGCSTDVNIFRTNENYSPKYLFHVLCQDVFFNFVNDNAIGTKMPRGDKRIIPTFLISIPYKDGSPDLNEQHRIASILSDMDSEIAAIEKEITKLRDLKTAMMQKMFCFCVAGGKNE